MDSMEIIRHAKFYSYNGELYASTFPEEWAIHQEPQTGTECDNCMYYGSWNGVFCMYCANCSINVYDGLRGEGCPGFIYEREYIMCDEKYPIMESNTYLKNIKLDDIGDREICDSRAIHKVPDDIVYVTEKYKEVDGVFIPVDEYYEELPPEYDYQEFNSGYTTIRSGMFPVEVGGKLTDDVALVESSLDSQLEENDTTIIYEDFHIDDIVNAETNDVDEESVTWYIDKSPIQEETDEEYFEKLEAASAIYIDPFVLDNMNFVADMDDTDDMEFISQEEDDESDVESDVESDDMPPLIPIEDDESEYDDMPPLIPIEDEDDYSDMPPLIPHPSMYPCNPDFEFMKDKE